MLLSYQIQEMLAICGYRLGAEKAAYWENYYGVVEG
jgi:hypothetical protein